MPCRFLPPTVLPPTVLLTLACLALSAAADPAPPLPRPSNLCSDILYTHKGEFVQVSPMRLLTMNAHVTQFAYDPLGIEIAADGSETSGETTTHFVKTLDVRTGHEMSRYTFAAPADDKTSQILLLGFSPSGKYLLLTQYSPDPTEPETARAEFVRWNLSTNPSSQRVIDPQAGLPPDQQSADLAGSADCGLSPDGRWLLFTQSVHVVKDAKPSRYRTVHLLYDTERDTFTPLTLPASADVRMPWIDKTHLRFFTPGVPQNNGQQRGNESQFDVVSGQVSAMMPTPDLSIVSKQYPDLSLDTQTPKQYDGHGAQESAGYLRSYIIWIRRTPFGDFPLDVAAAGLMPDYREDRMNYDPQAVWSPTGKQIAFLANKDLCVTDLSVAVRAMPNEKRAVGLKLSCADEQALAVSNLKQVGLALIQYMQGNDEKYPLADGWIKTIMPFAHTTDIFQVDGHAIVYVQPPGISLASVESPADTENAYTDLPCARVVLFCDGHVKVFPK